MMSAKNKKLSVKIDQYGFLVVQSAWNVQVAEELAAFTQITLTAAHWEIITVLRDYYQQYHQTPSQRLFVTHIKKVLGKEKGNSLYLMQLFSGNPAKNASRIAGLPKSKHCF